MVDPVRRCPDCDRSVYPRGTDYDRLGYLVCPLCGRSPTRPDVSARAEAEAEDRAGTSGFDWVRFSR
jgi:hypothetical protein